MQDSRSTSIHIRHIGSIGTNAGIDPSIGLFIDGVYQGTLGGKNTAAGAVNIISKAAAETGFPAATWDTLNSPSCKPDHKH